MPPTLPELRSLVGSVPVVQHAGRVGTRGRFDFPTFEKVVHRALSQGVHLVQADSASGLGLAAGFVAALLSVLHRSACVVWVATRTTVVEGGSLYGPGLHEHGVGPDRLVFVEAGSCPDVLWAVEESLRSGAVGAVVGELGLEGQRLDLTASRRLALRSERAGIPCYLTAVAEADDLGATATQTRWQVAPAPSRTGRGLLGAPCWTLELLKNRHGPCGRVVAGYSPSEGGFFPGAAPISLHEKARILPSGPSNPTVSPLVLPFRMAVRRPEGDGR